MVTIALAVVPSCGDPKASTADGSDSIERIAGIAVEKAALSPAGTPIGDGVSVPTGAWLVATRFPTRSEWSYGAEQHVDEGWAAVLLVEGPPLDVWNEVVRSAGMSEQARAAGSCVVMADPRRTEAESIGPTTTVSTESTAPPPTSGAGSIAPTTTAGAEWADPRRPLDGPARRGDLSLRCSATEGAWSVAMSAGVAPNCTEESPSSTLPKTQCGLLAQRHLTIHRATSPPSRITPTEGMYGATGYSSASPTGAPNVPPMPEEREDALTWLPAEGQLVDSRLDYFLWTGAVVSAGASSVVAPAMVTPCNSGLVAVLNSPLAPEKALGSITMSDQPDGNEVTTGAGPDGRAWATVLLSAAGGYYLDITAIEKSTGGSDGSWILATECGD